MTDPGDVFDLHSTPGGLDSAADLIAGGDDAPDVLDGTSDGEESLDEVALHDTPFHAPTAGQRLSAEELAGDLADD